MAFYRLTLNTEVDIRYNLTHEPKIATWMTDAPIHEGVFNAAGYKE